MESKGKRTLLTIEGIEKVSITRELKENEYSDMFAENQQVRIAKLSDRLDMIKKYQSNTSSSFYSSTEVSTLEKELDALKDEKVDVSKMADEFLETRCRVVEYEKSYSKLFADSDILAVLVEEIWAEVKELEKNSNLSFPSVPNLDPIYQMNLVCAYMTKTKMLPYNILQLVLEIQNPIEKAKLIFDLLEEFKRSYLKSWHKLSKGTETVRSSKEAKAQIDELYSYLRKVQEESSSPAKKMVLKTVRENLENKIYPKEIQEIIMDELQKFEDMNEMQPEFHTIKEFLELISCLPFGKTSEDNFDIKKAKEILDKDHFGMKNVKERILEFIAVHKLKKEIKGRNILLVGPPGTGKTSVASSIAKCLGREFVRISMGGESDVALLKGHRKTYVGAYPGKLV